MYIAGYCQHSNGRCRVLVNATSIVMLFFSFFNIITFVTDSYKYIEFGLV